MPKIPPALSKKEWPIALGTIRMRLEWKLSADKPDELARQIARDNAALPESDRRKIKQRWVELLRALASRPENWEGDDEDGNPIPDQELTEIADALESYLPPPPEPIVYRVYLREPDPGGRLAYKELLLTQSLIDEVGLRPALESFVRLPDGRRGVFERAERYDTLRLEWMPVDLSAS